MSDRQLDLFADASDESLRPGPPHRLFTLREQLPPGVAFGTSSWTFEGWKGLVYHRTYGDRDAFVRDSLAEYVRFPLFDLVGVDRTYYLPLREEEARHMAGQLPRGFRATFKVWNEVTTRVFPDHRRFGERAGRPNPSFLDAELFRSQVAGPLLATPLVDHVAAMILEIAPGPGRADAFEAALEAFLRDAPRAFHYAVELRDRHLLTERYLDLLRAHGGASHVVSYWSRMPTVREQLSRDVLMSDRVVCRLMIPPGGSYEELKAAYAPFDRLHRVDQPMREDTVHLVRAARRSGREALVIVNNKVEGSSPLTVAGIAERLVEGARDSPRIAETGD
ncbi:MAG: DUF72 domain-containing protein [Sandaracinaceae bacterium]